MIKRLLFIFVALFTLSVANAKNELDPVSMESYEQRWLDTEGTLSLKNNTAEDIHNVVFVIKYLDMNGKQLDYKEYKRNVEIAPGLSKKVDIPAYEYERSYSYYKSEARYGAPHKFKIEYELKGYNITPEEADSMDVDEDFGVAAGYSMGAIAFAIVLVLFIIGISIGMYVLVAVMAQKRNRSAVIWLLLSFIATPLLIIVILLCIGRARDDEY